MSQLRLLKPAMNTTAFLKVGILGFAGSGKTFTASEIAIGLCKKLTDKRPVAFFDTETGSDFLIPKFKKAGVEFLVVKSRSFMDLMDFMKEAQQVASVAIIDSISHVWQDLMSSYVKKLNRKNGLLFQDWSVIKQEWQQFTDIYVNSPIHTLLLGRAGYEYDFETNEAGKKELIKTGTKMKAEGEMGYEPSLLLEMTRLKKSEATGDADAKGWINRCHVLKDRTDTINGKEFDYPKYKNFEPVISFLNIGGEHMGVDTTRNSEDLFENPERSWSERRKQTDIVLEEIQGELSMQGLAGSSGDAQKKRTELMLEILGTSSKTAIENLPLAQLRIALIKIRTRRLIAENPPPAVITPPTIQTEVDDVPL